MTLASSIARQSPTAPPPPGSTAPGDAYGERAFDYACSQGFDAARGDSLNPDPTRLAFRCGGRWTSSRVDVGTNSPPGAALAVVECPAGMVISGFRVRAANRGISPKGLACRRQRHGPPRCR